MPKEYQSEKSPIFDSHKSQKTLRKLHIMSQVYAAKVCQLFCNTRYISEPVICLCYTSQPIRIKWTKGNGILMLSSHRCIYNKSIPLFSIPTSHIQATKSVFISIMFIWRVARCVNLINHQTYFCPCDASS